MTDDMVDVYYMRRRKAKIPLRELAEYLNCSITWISRYERKDGLMAEDKIEKYREYIDARI